MDAKIAPAVIKKVLTLKTEFDLICKCMYQLSESSDDWMRYINWRESFLRGQKNNFLPQVIPLKNHGICEMEALLEG